MFYDVAVRYSRRIIAYLIIDALLNAEVNKRSAFIPLPPGEGQRVRVIRLNDEIT